MMYVLSVSFKGWIVIPKELRERHGIHPGGKVLLTEKGDGLTLMPLPEDPIKSFRGLLKDYPLVDELLKSRKKEANLKLKTNSAL
jgi:AbrB family looped-hinge helix DNA binding protein